MKKISLIITLALFSTFSFGSDTEKKERINELMTLTNVSAMVDAAYSQSFQMMQGLKTELGIRPEEEQKFEQFMNRVSREMRTEMSWQKMEGPMSDVYMKNFSLTELQDMVAFYKTDSGQSVINKMPAIMQDSMMVTQNLLRNFLPKINEMAKEFKSELVASRTE